MRTRPDKIRQLALSAGSVEIDEAGYLTDPAKWTPEFANIIADREKIVVTPLHWDVIDFMRTYLDGHGVSADVRHAIGFLKEVLDLSKSDAKAKLYELFPAGHVQQTCKMAGMRQPRAWSTG